MARYTKEAVEFLKAYPIGSQFTPSAFDEWADAAGLLTAPPQDSPKQGDAWMAHLQRRHQVRYNINKGALALGVSREVGLDPFVVEAIGNNMWEVRSPELAILNNKVAARVASLVNTKRKQLSKLMESSDWKTLPAHEKAIAAGLYDDVNFFEASVTMHAKQLQHKFGALQSRIAKMLESGEIVTDNGGFKALLTDGEPETGNDGSFDDEDES